MKKQDISKDRKAEIKKEKYNDAQVISELKNNRPLLIDGCAIETDHKINLLITKIEWQTYDKCHAWLLDGYVLKTRNVTYYYKCFQTNEYINRTQEHLILVHNNFGWGDSNWENKFDLNLDGSGRNNTGWYHIGIFNVNGHKEPSNTFKSGTLYDYQFRNHIITNIY